MALLKQTFTTFTTMGTKSVHNVANEDSSLDEHEQDAFSTTMRLGLKPRHSQMIAMGACIGTGLFIGTGATLTKGGPAFILIGYTLLCGLVYCIVTAAVEVAAYIPISGGTMSYYGSRNVSNSLGFASISMVSCCLRRLPRQVW